MQTRQLIRNALTSVLQVIVSAGTIGVLYWFIERRLGIEALGIWGIVLASVSMTNLANLGMRGGATKFVAQYLAHGNAAYVSVLIQTAFLATALAMFVMAVGLYPFLERLLPFVLEQGVSAEDLDIALALVPFALLGFWLTSVAGVVLASLDGLHRIDLSSYLTMAASVIYMALALWWIPSEGLVGVAKAQVAQGGFLLVAAWVMLRRIHAVPLVPYTWSTSAFKEMLAYNVQFLAISMAALLVDPVTKGLLGRLGSVQAAGYYEYAYRLIMQVRALVNSAHRAVVPAVADAQERDPGQIEQVYAVSFRLILFLVTLGLPALIGILPVVAEFWLVGGYQPMFMGFGVILAVAWFLNMLCNPAYYNNMGTGQLRGNVIGHAIIAVVNVGLGLTLGYLYGAYGVVVAFGVALLAGSGTITVMYHRQNSVAVPQLWAKGQGALIVTCVLAGAAMLGVFALTRGHLHWAWQGVLMAALYALIVLPVAWRHAVAQTIRRWGAAFFSGAKSLSSAS